MVYTSPLKQENLLKTVVPFHLRQLNKPGRSYRTKPYISVEEIHLQEAHRIHQVQSSHSQLCFWSRATQPRRMLLMLCSNQRAPSSISAIISLPTQHGHNAVMERSLAGNTSEGDTAVCCMFAFEYEHGNLCLPACNPITLLLLLFVIKEFLYSVPSRQSTRKRFQSKHG